MQSKTRRVSLQAILDHIFAEQPPSTPPGVAAVGRGTIAVPTTRSAEDRSRMRQKVLEELARRRASRGDSMSTRSSHPTGKQSQASPIQQCLFHTGCGAAAEASASPARTRKALATSQQHRTYSDVRDLVSAAYCSLMRLLPEDHVILNPLSNAEFILRCRDLGATASEFVLNRTLLNNRKAKRHTGVVREPVPPLEAGLYDQIGHAVEIAASLVQRQWFLAARSIPTVDAILCGPEFRNVFDAFVRALTGSADQLTARLLLLAYRKSGRESAARLARAPLPDPLFTAPLQSLDPDDVPARCGVYRVLCNRTPLYVSGTANLRSRLSMHVDSCATGFLPSPIPFAVEGPVSVQVFQAPDVWTPRRAIAVAQVMGVEQNPALNWKRTGMSFPDRSPIVSCVAAAG